MKHWLLALLLLGAALVARAQPATPYAQLAKLVETPGTVFVRDSLWMDATEVANIHWVEYLHFLRQDSSAAFCQSQLPDVEAIKSYMRDDWQGNEFMLYNLRFAEGRTFNLDYRPIMGVSYAQAVQYCRWRSAKVNERLHSAEYLKAHPKLRKCTFRVEYRLPTAAEWEAAASGGLDLALYPYGLVLPPSPTSKAYRQQLVRLSPRERKAVAACLPTGNSQEAIFCAPFTISKPYYQGSISRSFSCPALDSVTGRNSADSFYRPGVKTSHIYANPPNARGLFNMLGNVAELTATPGVVKGGSFENPATTVLANLPYTGPQAWLGFRCACTVHIAPLP